MDGMFPIPTYIRRVRSCSDISSNVRPVERLRRSQSSTSFFSRTSQRQQHLLYRSNEYETGGQQRLKLIRTYTSSPEWNRVESRLKELQAQVAGPIETQGPIRDLIRNAALSYCVGANTSNFRLLDDEEVLPTLHLVLPRILSLALELSSIHVGPIPALRTTESGTLALSRKLCSCLLANGFLCTFPIAGRTNEFGEPLPSINFDEFFDTQNSHQANYSVKVEKLKCILAYLLTVTVSEDAEHDMVFFRKKCIDEHIQWTLCEKPLCGMEIQENGSIEDCADFLHVDFANRLIGGGVLRHGAVQEEIRFCICPELIISRAFTEPLAESDAIEILGAKNYNRVEGYSRSLKHISTVDIADRRGDNLVAIDAVFFQRYNKNQQYQKVWIDRELHKAYVGFVSDMTATMRGISSGNWGCGAFNGDPQLKFLLQWMAASAANWKLLRYYTFGDLLQKQEFAKMSNFLSSRKVTVSGLYVALIESESGNGSVFEKIFRHF